ncbi:MAG: phosphoribosyltransferase [Flavipsychrobacter sp.]|jgi:pyrimidine operon attenuation protein/uracil phosphoribosyltransferase|nr:phosphoribosyltransferase [Flavipsychrobacter sp.]
MATKKKRVLILDKEQIANKLRRMAYEIWERNSDEKEITLIGIEGGGKIVAENLSTILKKISPLKVKNTTLSINKKKPLNNAIDFNEDLTGRSVILVDDVVNSGKTIFYSLTAILAYDLKKMMVAVLVDRKHKNFPIASDIIGHGIATTLQEHIEVETEGKEVFAAYLE